MKLISIILLIVILTIVKAYDPNDKEISNIIPAPGTFEAFYPRETQGIPNSAVRASHNHASFFQHRNPGNFMLKNFCNFSTHYFFVALIDIKNAAAYGYRFDGKRRFNFD
jgi:hypothetical protein